MGVEDDAHPVDHPGWGGIKFHRVSPGDPISGFDADGLPIYSMHMIPGTLEAENYDYFPISGNGRSYFDSTEGNRSGLYRDDDVDLVKISGNGYALSQLERGEWLTYTVYVAESGNYDLSVHYAARDEGAIQVTFDGQDKTGSVVLPSSTNTQWKTFTVAQHIPLEKGVQSMRVIVSEGKAAYILDTLSIQPSKPVAVAPDSLVVVPEQSVIEEVPVQEQKEEPVVSVEVAPELPVGKVAVLNMRYVFMGAGVAVLVLIFLLKNRGSR
jgi:hypothetical protein